MSCWGKMSGLALAAAAALFASGCASVSHEAARAEVERTVAARLGDGAIWNTGSAADQQVRTELDALLARELTPESAIQIALLNNRRIQAIYEYLAIAQTDLVSAGLLRNPVFDAEWKFADEGDVVELSIVQEFLDLLYLPLRRRLAADAFEAAKLRIAGEVLALAGEVRAGLIEFIGAQQTLELRQQVLAAAEASYDVARRLRAAGNISEFDLANERALYEESRLATHAAETALIEQRENVNELLGLWGRRTNWKAAARLPEVAPEQIAGDDLEARAVERSLALAAQRFDLSRTARRAGVARWTEALPELELGAAAEHEPDGEWSVGPAISIPLPIFTQGQPARARAFAEFRRARDKYAATAAEVRARVRGAYARAVGAQQRVAYLQETLLPLRQRIVDQAQLHYNAMQIGPVQLLQTKQQQVQTAADYVGAIRDYWIARAQLDQLLHGSMPSRAGAPDAGIAAASTARSEGGH